MADDSTILSRLEKVAVRDVWADEARDFTPWLATEKNISLLGEAIGLELEVEAQEQRVGLFRADILCKDLHDGSWVLIENQLNRTDHSHLGQLLTYAAGLEAVTIVWVAQKFTEEPRAALDWLNDKTPDGIAFFGLEIELWRIADSPIAPNFNVTCKPNDWVRSTTRAWTADPERASMCAEYWKCVLHSLKPSEILLQGAKPVRKQDIRFPVGWKDFWLKSYFSCVKGKLGVWVGCRGPKGFENYSKLASKKNEIELAFGKPLDWRPDEMKNRGACIISSTGFDPNNRDDWPRQHEFLTLNILNLFNALNPIVELIENRENEDPEESLT